MRARHALDAVRLDGATRYNAELVFEEVVANVVGHGAPDGHALEVRFTLEIRDFTCHLLTLMPEESISQLKKALDTFMESI